MPAHSLTRDDVRSLLERVHSAFAAHRDEIDALNVFPVPDGDTGTNLVFTVRSALEELHDLAPPELWDGLVRGAMMGARGNSGVIFSQVLRGLAEALAEFGDTAPTPAVLADGWMRARELAYDAVADPLEGTMLSAISAAAEAAGDERDAADLETVTSRIVSRVHEAVARTREQLEANRAAGVVDAGARGVEVFAIAVHDHVTGAPDVDHDAPAPVVDRSNVRNVAREAGSDEYRFEVQYLLEADEDRAPDLRDALRGLGDSVVVVAASGAMNVHVHTNDIAAAIDAGAAVGRAWRIQVTEFAEERAAAEEAGQVGTDAPFTVLAVLPGPGLRALAEDSGAIAIHGAAGDLPSVADLLQGARRSGADRVLVLPGHPNVVPTAQQAAKVAAEDGGPALEVIDVVISPLSVLAGLAVVDPSDAAATASAVREAAHGCRSGEVVAAVRDADGPAGHVRQGQFLAVVDGDVVAVRDEPVEALQVVAATCDAATAEVVTLVVGADVDEDELEHALSILGEGAAVDVIDGGQRPVRYFLGAE